MKRALCTYAVISACLLLSACAAGTPNAGGTFWFGLWHGFIAPITFIVSLFDGAVRIYEVHNNGGWYDFGFLIGIHAIFGGRETARWRR